MLYLLNEYTAACVIILLSNNVGEKQAHAVIPVFVDGTGDRIGPQDS